jgi:hypothetical protein
MRPPVENDEARHGSGSPNNGMQRTALRAVADGGRYRPKSRESRLAPAGNSGATVALGRLVAVSDFGAGDRPNAPSCATDPSWQPKVYQS